MENTLPGDTKDVGSAIWEAMRKEEEGESLIRWVMSLNHGELRSSSWRCSWAIENIGRWFHWFRDYISAILRATRLRERQTNRTWEDPQGISWWDGGRIPRSQARTKPEGTFGWTSEIHTMGQSWVRLQQRWLEGNQNTTKMIRALKPKDLMLCSTSVGDKFPLQEDGWWVRQDIVWNKPKSNARARDR